MDTEAHLKTYARRGIGQLLHSVDELSSDDQTVGLDFSRLDEQKDDTKV